MAIWWHITLTIYFGLDHTEMLIKVMTEYITLRSFSPNGSALHCFPPQNPTPHKSVYLSVTFILENSQNHDQLQGHREKEEMITLQPSERFSTVVNCVISNWKGCTQTHVHTYMNLNIPEICWLCEAVVMSSFLLQSNGILIYSCKTGGEAVRVTTSFKNQAWELLRGSNTWTVPLKPQLSKTEPGRIIVF